ncbi:MAG: caspase family protein, partial [Thermodesulfobacterium sp.]|nr:caspase family protein [Thermodesulfobacterium sp.]
NYNSIPDLDYVKNDSKLIYNLASCYLGVPRAHIKILENPTYAILKKELKIFVENIRKKDSKLYFYYSGHGILDSKGRFYILPADASIENEEILKESGINIDELKKFLTRSRGKKIAFIDACRLEPSWKPAVMVVYKPELKDMVMLFSTKEGQLSNADREKKYSAFTRALYEMASSGLVNLDFNNDGYVEIRELVKPLTNWVRKVSSDGKQTPDVWGPEEFEVFPVE